MNIERKTDIIELFKSNLESVEYDFYDIEQYNISFVFKEFDIENIYNKLSKSIKIRAITFYFIEFVNIYDIRYINADWDKYKQIDDITYNKYHDKLFNKSFFDNDIDLVGGWTAEEKTEIRFSNLFKMKFDEDVGYLPYFRHGKKYYKLITEFEFAEKDMDISLRNYKLNQLI